MSTRPLMTTIGCSLVATTAIALVAAQVGLSLQAQTLLAPSFTAAQAATGRATYTENCASCHGANLDDGAFAPPLKGPSSARPGSARSADQLFTKIETMPPAAPGSLGAGGPPRSSHTCMSQNQLVAADKPVPSDPAAAEGHVACRDRRAGRAAASPAAWTSACAAAQAIRSTATRRSPTRCSRTRPAGEWLTWRRGYDGHGLQPAAADHEAERGELRPAWSWSLPAGPNEGDAALP